MSRTSLLVMVAVVIAFGVGVAGATAQEPASQGQASTTAAVGTAFTYQGRLNDGGIPASSDYDFQFALYDDLAGGTQLGSTVDQTITVGDGYFTTILDFGQAFQGAARYLEVRVRTAGTGDPYTTLTPRQELTPVPYSLALPGLWTEQNDTSPNVIGGHEGNAPAAGVVGATISGGGASGSSNHVADHYGTVGGGSNNAAGNADGDPSSAVYATVGGGNGNLAVAPGSTIGGGVGNAASGIRAFVGGGLVNFAAGDQATVGGGQHNSASETSATVAGGFTNNASGEGATVGGGANNIADGRAATIAGGDWNHASGWRSTTGGGSGNQLTGELTTIGGGQGNKASAASATIPGGAGAEASHYGQLAYASGPFVDTGDAQTSTYVLRKITTDAMPTILLLDGWSEHLTIPVSRTLAFEALIVARTEAGQSAGYRAQGVIENQAGTTGFVGMPTVTTLGEDVAAWVVTIVADDLYDALFIQVTGQAGVTIRWVATARTAEVAW